MLRFILFWLLWAPSPVHCASSKGPIPTNIKSRLSVVCNDMEPAELNQLRTCWSYRSTNKVLEIQWGGDYSNLQAAQYDAANERWLFISPLEGFFPPYQCNAWANGGWCARPRVCRMIEKLYGELPHVPVVNGVNMHYLGDRGDLAFDYPDVVTERCAVCQLAPCDSYDCREGRYNGAVHPTVAGEVIRRPQCTRSCAAGTFMTCRSGVECSYQVYTDVNQARDRDTSGGPNQGSLVWYGANVFLRKLDANVLPIAKAPPPVTGCYPCHHAAFLTHYGTYANTDDALYDAGFVRFVCPGGSEAPRRCGTSQVSRFDAASGAASGCGCQPSYYWNATQGRCALCPAGFVCNWSGMQPPVPAPCPVDTYSLAGAAQCTPCETLANCGNGLALTRCKPSQGGEAPGVYQSQNARCVACDSCQQLGGSVPCYRVSPRIAAVQ